MLGIKETPMEALVQQRSPVHLPTANGPVPRTHVMFSHTAKGQPYNTGLLSQFASPSDGLSGSAAEFEKTLELWPRLIDYELLTNDQGKRTVGFGWFAGGPLSPLSLDITWLLIDMSFFQSQAFSSPFRQWLMRISNSGSHHPSS